MAPNQATNHNGVEHEGCQTSSTKPISAVRQGQKLRVEQSFPPVGRWFIEMCCACLGIAWLSWSSVEDESRMNRAIIVLASVLATISTFMVLRPQLRRMILGFAIYMVVAAVVPMAIVWLALQRNLYMFTIPLAMAYLAWYSYDLETAFKGGRNSPSQWLRTVPFTSYYHYFQPVLTLPKVAQSQKEPVHPHGFDPKKLYLFAAHPHGVLCSGVYNTFVHSCRGTFSDRVPDLKFRIMTVKASFFTPLWRELQLALGFIDASRSSAQAAMRKGFSLVVVPGGAAEVPLNTPRDPPLLLKKRKGFIKLSMMHGASLVPCFSFGESVVMDQYQPEAGSLFHKFQNWFRGTFGFVIPFCTTAYPRQVSVETVVGTPIPVERVEDPSPEQVEKVHQQYIKALTELHEKHRHRHGYSKLRIV